MVQYFPVITGSLTVQGNVRITGSINATSGITGSISGTATTALTASSVANLNQNVQVTGSLGVTSTITAQTLNVQQVTSSIVYSSGSNVFGNSQSNTQQFTGSVLITGSLTATGAATFSSTVSAGDEYVTTAGNNKRIFYSGTATTGYQYMSIKNTSGQLIYGIEGSVTGNLATGDIAYSSGVYTANTTPLHFGANQVVAMTIINGGNIGIGTTSPANKLEVAGTIRATTQTDPASGTGLELFYRGADAASYIQSYDRTSSAWKDIRMFGNNLIFGTSDAERIKVSSTGYTYITSTNSYASTSSTAHAIISNRNNDNNVYFVHSGDSSPYGPYLWFTNASPNNGTNYFFACADATQSKFIILSNGSCQSRTGSYGTISDIKFKENIVDATSKLDEILKLKVRNFNLIGFKDKHIGFIAQEFEEVFPKMVETSIEKDTNEEYKSIKTTVLIPILVKAIQELSAKVDQQQAIIESLVNK